MQCVTTATIGVRVYLRHIFLSVIVSRAMGRDDTMSLYPGGAGRDCCKGAQAAVGGGVHESGHSAERRLSQHHHALGATFVIRTDLRPIAEAGSGDQTDACAPPTNLSTGSRPATLSFNSSTERLSSNGPWWLKWVHSTFELS